MAKKKNRSVSGASAAAPAAAGERTAVSPRASFSQEFKPDYSPVIADLKKIAILAASFVSILVILSFFLR